MTIWKLVMGLGEGRTSFMVHEGAQVLSCHAQHDRPAIWIAVDQNKEKVRKTFCAVHTGSEVPKGASRFIGTCICLNGDFVLHIYEVSE